MRKTVLIATISILIIFGSGLSGDSFGQEVADKITTIHIVTPAWKNQTHEDGTGLFFEIVRAVYKPLGIELKYHIMPWKRASYMVENQKADAMFCVLQDSKFLIPQYPLFVDYTAVLFKKENIREWKGLETLQGKTAAWPRGYDYHKQPQMKGISLKFNEVKYLNQGFAMLNSDRVDFYIDALVDLEFYIKERDIDMTPYQLEIPYGKNTYIGFAQTERSQKLIKIHDTRILELLNSGELEKLFKKWGIPLPHYKMVDE